MSKLKLPMKDRLAHRLLAEAAANAVQEISTNENIDLFPVIDRLQERLKVGCEIQFQDGRWHLFAASGHSIVSGLTLKKMLIELVMTDQFGSE